MNKQYVKVRFTNGTESTAGLVLDYEKVRDATVSELSKYFPMSEANKMHKVIMSHPYDTWLDAFNHQFGAK